MATAEQKIQPNTQPVQKKEPGKPKLEHPFQKLCAFKIPIVIQQKGGIVVKGRTKWFRNGLLKLTDVEIIGTNKQVKTEWLLLDHQTIAHVHPDPDAKVATDGDGASAKDC